MHVMMAIITAALEHCYSVRPGSIDSIKFIVLYCEAKKCLPSQPKPYIEYTAKCL